MKPLILLFITATFALNSYSQKKTWLSISGGYTNSTVIGSMVKRNIQFGDEVKQTNRSGFSLNALFETPLNPAYIKYGLGLLYRQVNPMNGTWALYKDELKTTYLSLPFLIGGKVLPPTNAINWQIEAGALANMRIGDNSEIGPDRVGFKTPFLTASLCAGTTVSMQINSGLKWIFEYRYIADITSSYIEALYWSSEEPNKKFIYKYRTHSISMGFQWRL
jgi:hypothetical protein